MKNILKAFTYIELLVVITIITLISSAGVFYFLDFVKTQEVSQKMDTIKDDFDSLEIKINNFSIFDYEIKLDTGNLSNGYISYINNFDIPFNQYININLNTGNGIVTTNGTSAETWNIKIYKKHKLFLSENNSANTNYNFTFNDEPYYKITGTLSGEVLNEINLNYYAEDNLFPEKNNLIVLSSINSKNDKTGTNINSLSIKNIGGTKSIIGDGVNYNKVYLFFESNGIEGSLEVR